MLKIKKISPLREKITRKLLGLTYRLDNSGDAVFTQNGEEEFMEQLGSNYSGPITVFDIGANMGGYTDILLRKRPNIRLNNFGLSDTEGTFAIYKDEETSGLSSLYQRNLSFCNMSLSIKEAAEMKRAKNYIESNGIKKINLVKMDIEGHEISALKGFGEYLNADFIDAIQFEYGGANIDSHTNLMDFYNLLLPRDFIICKVKKHYLEIRDYNPRLDNFVYQNFVAISKKSGFLH